MAGGWRTYLWLLMLLNTPLAGADSGTLLIGSGSQAGVYYQAALTICNVFNRYGDARQLCQGRPTPGSVFNIQGVSRGLLDFSIAQSDRHWEAVHGRGEWQDAPVTTLRSLFSLHSEAIMLVARLDSGIEKIADIRGRRVNIGNPGSGHRINAMDLLRFHDLVAGEDFTALELQQDRASRALVDNKLDAFFYTVGNPSEAVARPARLTPIRIVPIEGLAIQRLLDAQPYLVPITLPYGIYPGVAEPVPTIAVKATLVSDARVSDDLVYRLVRLVFEHLEEIQNFHPALHSITPQSMLEGLSAPLHRGAERYYREQGIVPNPAIP